MNEGEPLSTDLTHAALKRSSLSFEETALISGFYGTGPLDQIVLNQRGLINTTFELQSHLFLTIFQGRSSEELEAVAEVANSMPQNVPIARPRLGDTGYSLELEDGTALLMPRLQGSHYVGIHHTDKYPIGGALHESLASFFWQLQKGLSAAPSRSKSLLRNPSRATKNTKPAVLPIVAEPLSQHAPSETPELISYDDLIHDDVERQNVLNVGHRVTGIVDLDSIRQGNILYEFGHFMFNIVFCDPQADLRTASVYMREMKKAGVIDPSDVEAIYPNIYRFATSDIVDFEDLNKTPGLNPNKLTNLELLVEQYGKALSLARKFFNSKHVLPSVG